MPRTTTPGSACMSISASVSTLEVSENSANSMLSSAVCKASEMRAVVPSLGENQLCTSVPPTLKKCGVLSVFCAPNRLLAALGKALLPPHISSNSMR